MKSKLFLLFAALIVLSGCGVSLNDDGGMISNLEGVWVKEGKDGRDNVTVFALKGSRGIDIVYFLGDLEVVQMGIAPAGKYDPDNKAMPIKITGTQFPLGYINKVCESAIIVDALEFNPDMCSPRKLEEYYNGLVTLKNLSKKDNEFIPGIISDDGSVETFNFIRKLRDDDRKRVADLVASFPERLRSWESRVKVTVSKALSEEYRKIKNMPHSSDRCGQFERLAKMSHGPAEYSLGMCYYEGHHSSGRNIELAFKLFDEARKSDVAQAYTALSHMYLYGEYVEKDAKIGLNYAERAYELEKNTTSAYNYGELLYAGSAFGIASDVKSATTLFKTALELPDVDSGSRDLAREALRCIDNGVPADMCVAIQCSVAGGNAPQCGK